MKRTEFIVYENHPEIVPILPDEIFYIHTEELETKFPGMTPKERETLRMIADGFATKQIAGELGVSVKTISAHRSHLMRKLDRHSVAELTKYAILNGLTSVE